MATVLDIFEIAVMALVMSIVMTGLCSTPQQLVYAAFTRPTQVAHMEFTQVVNRPTRDPQIPPNIPIGIAQKVVHSAFSTKRIMDPTTIRI